MLFNLSDRDEVVNTTKDWQIRSHCHRGYIPWYTLHKKRIFFNFTWWSNMIKFGEIKQLEDFIERWENF